MAKWKCDKCGKEFSSWFVNTTITEVDESGTPKEYKVCIDCAENQQREASTEYSIPQILAHCEQHLRVIKGILIAGAVYLVLKELIVLFLALSK